MDGSRRTDEKKLATVRVVLSSKTPTKNSDSQNLIKWTVPNFPLTFEPMFQESKMKRTSTAVALRHFSYTVITEKIFRESLSGKEKMFSQLLESQNPNLKKRSLYARKALWLGGKWKRVLQFEKVWKKSHSVESHNGRLSCNFASYKFFRLPRYLNPLTRRWLWRVK